MINKILQTIGTKYGTDKSQHLYRGLSYLDIYERHFDSIRHEVKRILEIGVLNGKSLLMWQEYFPNAEIIGVDINPTCKQFENERVKIYIGNQNDEQFLKLLTEQIGIIDVLIDDGSHITKHQLKTFEYLYPKISNNGFYIIEDLRNSYEDILNHHDIRKIWPGMSYNNKNEELKNYRIDFNNWVNEMVKKLDYHTEEKILGIYHYPMILIIENKF